MREKVKGEEEIRDGKLNRLSVLVWERPESRKTRVACELSFSTPHPPPPPFSSKVNETFERWQNVLPWQRDYRHILWVKNDRRRSKNGFSFVSAMTVPWASYLPPTMPLENSGLLISSAKSLVISPWVLASWNAVMYMLFLRSGLRYSCTEKNATVLEKLFW